MATRGLGAAEGSGRPKREGFASTLTSLTRLDLLYRSPSLIIAAIAVSVFASNALVMTVLASFVRINNFRHYILDSTLQVALLFPALIVLVFRPIQLHLVKRRGVENEVACERNKLKTILDALPAGICLINRGFQIEYANTALLMEFGPVAGRTCHEYFQGSLAVCLNCGRNGRPGGKSNAREVVSGTSGKMYEIFETSLQNADNTLSSLAMVRDITAAKVAEYDLRASRQQLRSLSAHQQRTREEERAAVSREIHDELGQVLATVQLGVSSLAEYHHDHHRLAGKVAGMEQLITGAIKTIQRIATELRPSILDELGLAEAVEWQAAEFVKRTGITCIPDILLLDRDYRKEVATAVFRICQEALTNVMRHSAATRVAVSLEERRGRLVLVVADNGCGITGLDLRESHSLGLSGMRERAYALGGRVRLCRSLQQGTVVVAHIPVSPGTARS